MTDCGVCGGHVCEHPIHRIKAVLKDEKKPELGCKWTWKCLHCKAGGDGPHPHVNYLPMCNGEVLTEAEEETQEWAGYPACPVCFEKHREEKAYATFQA